MPKPKIFSEMSILIQYIIYVKKHDACFTYIN